MQNPLRWWKHHTYCIWRTTDPSRFNEFYEWLGVRDGWAEARCRDCGLIRRARALEEAKE